MFDRETRREKIIEAKQREQKLKTKSSAKADATTTKDKQAQLAEAEARMVREAGKEFEELVEKLVSGRTPGSVSPKSAFRPSGQDGVKLYFKNERSKFFLEINERRPPPPPPSKWVVSCTLINVLTLVSSVVLRVFAVVFFTQFEVGNNSMLYLLKKKKS